MGVMMKKNTMIWACLTFLWMAVIFLFSAQNAVASDKMSGGITEAVTRFLFQAFDTYSQSMQEIILMRVSFFVRKLAHFTEYAILGFLLSGLFHSMTDTCFVKIRNKSFKKKDLSWGVGTLYAISDELHQFFSEGRAPRVFDVCVDSLGIVAGIVGFWLVCYTLMWYNRKANKKL